MQNWDLTGVGCKQEPYPCFSDPNIKADFSVLVSLLSCDFSGVLGSIWGLSQTYKTRISQPWANSCLAPVPNPALPGVLFYLVSSIVTCRQDTPGVWRGPGCLLALSVPLTVPQSA